MKFYNTVLNDINFVITPIQRYYKDIIAHYDELHKAGSQELNELGLAPQQASELYQRYRAQLMEVIEEFIIKGLPSDDYVPQGINHAT